MKIDGKKNYVYMIAIQILYRLESIYSKLIIHRYIKPENFLIGIYDPTVIYLIDFGFAKKYRSSSTNKHSQIKNNHSVTGSGNFISFNTNSRFEQSRKDDLEALDYCLIYMVKGNLTWQDMFCDENLTRKKKFVIACKMKKEIKFENLCEKLPKCFIDYFKYCRSFQFEQGPDYNYLRHLFEEILTDNNMINDLNFTC